MKQRENVAGVSSGTSNDSRNQFVRHWIRDMQTKARTSPETQSRDTFMIAIHIL